MTLEQLLTLIGAKEVDIHLLKQRVAELEQALKVATIVPPKDGVE